MDSKELMAILDEWQNTDLDFMKASLKLMTLGCSGTEAAALMNQYPKKPKEETTSC